MTSDEQPTIQELCFYFYKFFRSQFQDAILKLENQQFLFIFTWSWNTFEICERRRATASFFGTRVKLFTSSSGWL